jgi:hypothetical protein
MKKHGSAYLSKYCYLNHGLSVWPETSHSFPQAKPHQTKLLTTNSHIFARLFHPGILTSIQQTYLINSQALLQQKWKSITGLKEAKEPISGPSAKRSKDLLKLNRDQLRWIVGLYTGHCHLKKQLFKLGLIEDPTYERCLEEDESATRTLYDCEATAHLRFRHLGQLFMEPSDYYDTPINKVLHFIRSVELIKG